MIRALEYRILLPTACSNDLHRPKPGTTRSVKGTGLGLAICAELATLMHAEVGYYNDQGAHFWVDMPTSGSGEALSTVADEETDS